MEGMIFFFGSGILCVLGAMAWSLQKEFDEIKQLLKKRKGK